MIHPNFTGLWQANAEKSCLAGPAAQVTVKITQGEEELHQDVLITRLDGNQERQEVTFPLTGAEVRRDLRGAPLTIRARWAGPELIIESTYGGNVFRDYWSLSDGDRTLTMEHRDDAMAGQKTVLERVE